MAIRGLKRIAPVIVLGMIFGVLGGCTSNHPAPVGAAASGKDAGVYIPGGRNVEAARYANTPGYPAFSDKAKWLGTLSGTWKEMGYQLGQSSKDMISYTTDIWWEKMCKSKGVHETLEAMKRYETQIAALDSDQIELLKGIAEGASETLSKSKYSNPSNEFYADSYYRVIAAGIWDSWLWGNPKADNFMGNSKSAKNSVTGAGINHLGCNSMAVKGSITVGGHTISTQLRHTPQEALCYQESFVYSPQNGNKVWTVGSLPASNGLMLINDKGVVIHAHFGGATNTVSIGYRGGPYYSDAFGVPWPNVLLYAAVHAGTAEDAIQYLTLGPEQYRRTTGRKTLLRDGAWNWLVADSNTLAVVEVSANRYAVRKAGEFIGVKWTNPNYIVCANHFLCNYSYDENNQRTNVPMTIFNATPGSEERFWTLMWELRDYTERGPIDEYTIQHIVRGTYIRDRNTGKKIYFAQDKNGRNVPYAFAKWGVQGTMTDEGRVSGTNAAKISILDGNKSRALWTLGNPIDWEGAWDEFRFVR
jgi:hypothetical protein